MALRNLGNDYTGSKIDSRRWVEGERGNQIGEIGGEWEAISVTQRWMILKDAFLNRVLVIAFGIFEILMGRIREEGGPRRKLGIGPAGNTRNIAPINVMVDAIEGIVGPRSMVEGMNPCQHGGF